MNIRKKGLDTYKSVMNSKHDEPEKEKPVLSETKEELPPLIKKEDKEGLLKIEKWNYRKIAKFLILIGKEEAVKVLKHLNKNQIEEISKEITTISYVEKGEADRILADFGMIMKSGPVSLNGGVETARFFLKSAFGEEKGEQILCKAVPEAAPRPFDFFQDLSLERQILLIKDESTSVLSIILLFLDSVSASKIIKALPADKQKEVILRLARMKKVETSVIKNIENFLKEKLRNQGSVETTELNGKSALAEILQHMPFSQEKKILDDLKKDTPDVSEDVRKLMFTEDTVLKIDDRDFEAVLRDYSDSEIALLLKKGGEPWVEKISSNISARRMTLIHEETLSLGSVRRSEIEQTVDNFIQNLRFKEEKGLIKIYREDEKYL